MTKEIRSIGGYDVLSSVRIGVYEIALCENTNAPEDEVFLCGYIENNGLFERLNDCMVSADYADIAACYGERIKEKALEIQKEIEKVKNNIGDDSELTSKDCLPVNDEDNLEYRVIVLRGDLLRPEFRRASKQLFFCVGGFGAYANARGRACFAHNLYDGYQIRCSREDILGVMPRERLPEWAKQGLNTIMKKIAADRTVEGEQNVR